MNTNQEFDVCVIGSGAGAGPVIYELSKAGYSVVVLEKGPWYRTEDFAKDELAVSRRDIYSPNLRDERHVIEQPQNNGNWKVRSTFDSGISFWNGNCVGGSSNFMSAYFERLKPSDFKLLSTYGEIEGANIADWPISYNDLEPYYTKVESVVGISGKAVAHKFAEPRSTADFPYPPLSENILSEWIDNAAHKLNWDIIPLPRGIISQPKNERNSCYYSNYCGSYGCASNAKSSSRVALIHDALRTGNCHVIPNAKVYHLETNGNNKITRAWYYDNEDKKQSIRANIFVVAAQAVETSRLLLMSKNKEFPNGLANNSGQVGKNLLFSGGGLGNGYFYYDELPKNDAEQLAVPGVFVNRSLTEFYELEDPDNGKKIKGGTAHFLFEHAVGIGKAIRQKWKGDSLLYGTPLQNRLKQYFTNTRKVRFEIFVDWLPNDNCHVTLDPKVKDKWGDPVARIKTGYHPHDIKVGKLLAEKCEQVFETIGAKHISSNISGNPPANLQAGGCRFGNNPKTSVLDKNCKAHEVDNLYVTDGSFMPTGGSITYTWTIYANSFRVADKIKERLG
jgi:choline dehydrogenase-like flavoprotein